MRYGRSTLLPGLALGVRDQFETVEVRDDDEPAVGDEALAAVGRPLAAAVRREDVVAWSG